MERKIFRLRGSINRGRSDPWTTCKGRRRETFRAIKPRIVCIYMGEKRTRRIAKVTRKIRRQFSGFSLRSRNGRLEGFKRSKNYFVRKMYANLQKIFQKINLSDVCTVEKHTRCFVDFARSFCECSKIRKQSSITPSSESAKLQSWK